MQPGHHVERESVEIRSGRHIRARESEVVPDLEREKEHSEREGRGEHPDQSPRVILADRGESQMSGEAARHEDDGADP